MWEKNLTNLDEKGTFRSLNGAADENIFIGKASKCGFFCFFKVWRDMPYDAVLDYNNILYRVEVKGSSNNKYALTRGSRSGKQIDRTAENRERRITRDDCDFIVCVDSNNGDCFIVPVDILDITDRKNFRTSALLPFKEKWELFIHGDGRLSPSQTRDGLRSLSLAELQVIASNLGVTVSPEGYRPPEMHGITITDEKDKLILNIWYKLCE